MIVFVELCCASFSSQTFCCCCSRIAVRSAGCKVLPVVLVRRCGFSNMSNGSEFDDSIVFVVVADDDDDDDGFVVDCSGMRILLPTPAPVRLE